MCVLPFTNTYTYREPLTVSHVHIYTHTIVLSHFSYYFSLSLSCSLSFSLTLSHTHTHRRTEQLESLTSGEDARVHEGSHAEVGQDEEEDNAIVKGHSWGDCLRKPRAPGGSKKQRIFISLAFSHFAHIRHKVGVNSPDRTWCLLDYHIGKGSLIGYIRPDLKTAMSRYVLPRAPVMIYCL